MSKTKISLIYFGILFCIIATILLVFLKSTKSKEGNISKNQYSSGSSSSGSGGLSVSNSANPLDLGQIPSSGIEGANNSKSGSGANSGSNLDPSSFSEYEKYKTGTSALFGEIVKGNGAEVKVDKDVAILYKLWLTNGLLVEESKTNKDGKLEALSFKFGQSGIINGLQQGMEGMKVGGKRLIIVPPSVGYGNQKHESIPANSVLIFQVELVQVK